MKKNILHIALAFIAYFISSCSSEKGEIPVKETNCDSVISYSTGIIPLVNANCAVSGCHVSGASMGDFTTYTGLKLKADNGSLNKQVVIQKSMPPSGSGTLTDAERQLFECWIKQNSPNN